VSVRLDDLGVWVSGRWWVTMNIFDGTASIYDIAVAPLELAGLSRLRQRLVAEAHGAVLEIGAGTGVNFSHYAEGTRVFALDESREMLSTARKRPCRACATVTQADAQSLPFSSHTFQTVIGTLVFCSIPDPTRALTEIRRVLQSGGTLLLLEHTRGHHPIAAALTDLLNPVWFSLNGSCHLNRQTARSVAEAGFHVTRLERHAGGIVQVIRATA
jgi:ubiquinone/menaquinone biosynthesis C-methylase UbiE